MSHRAGEHALSEAGSLAYALEYALEYIPGQFLGYIIEHSWAQHLLILALALGLDFAFGDPKSRYHPTAWIGRMIAAVAVRAKRASHERAGGILAVALPCGMAVAAVSAAMHGAGMLQGAAGAAVLVLAGAVLLKSTIAVRGMERHALLVMESIRNGSMRHARGRLSMIVKRDTKSLSERQVVSGVIESVAESIVDGITGPLFYFGLLGLPGAFAYRVANTADSMVGYKSAMFASLGWFGANCDKMLNFAPSRITVAAIMLGAAALRMNWRNAYRTARRYGRATASPNAGYPMAAVAGALGVRLEKAGHYVIGDGRAELTIQDVQGAVKLMKAAAVIFGITVTAPLMLALSHLGWWIHA